MEYADSQYGICFAIACSHTKLLSVEINRQQKTGVFCVENVNSFFMCQFSLLIININKFSVKNYIRRVLFKNSIKENKLVFCKKTN